MEPNTFIQKMLPLLRKQWPTTGCEVRHSNPLELMVGVILSAQCTDKRVNEVTKTLFKKYRKASDYVKVDSLELENDIRTTGFFRSKAKNIQGACKILVEKHDGKMPGTMDELLELPGIGRKSANVILGACFGVASGIVVDTHMIRLAHDRFRLSASEDPVQIEKDLTAIVPKKEWIYFSQAMVLHGRYICVARTPRCWECELYKVCPFVDKVLENPKPNDQAIRETLMGVPIRVRSN